MSKNTGTSELINYFDLGVNGDVGIAGSLDINTIANATTDTDTFLVSDTGIIKYRTGAQLLSDIGAAPAVAGGYVPYTGATTNVDLGVYNLTAGAIIANGSGSNSGIVHLESNAIHSLVNGYGSIASGTTNQFNLYQTTGAGVFRGAILSLNSITEFATRTFTLPDADGTLALTSQIPANPVGGTGTTNYLPKFTGASTIGNSQVFDNGTNVGINTNTPGKRLDIVTNVSQDGIRITGSSNPRITIIDSTNNVQFDALVTDTEAVIRTDTNHPLHFTTNGALKMSITSGGNVLIGNPPAADNGARLQVSGTAYFSTSASVNGLNLGSTYASKLGVYNSSSAANMELGTATNTNGTIVSRATFYNVNNGNTGNESSANFIGVASIETQLVTANGNASGTSGGSIIFKTKRDGGTLDNTLTLASTGAATFSSSVRAQGDFFAASGTSTAASIRFWDANTGLYYPGSDALGFIASGAERMRITSGGNVGIGTTNIDASTNYTSLNINGTNGSEIYLKAANTNHGYIYANSGGFNLGSISNIAVDFLTNSSTKMRITSGGNVLIGTTTDSGYKLDVNGTGRFTDLVTSNTGFRTNATNGYILRNDGNNLNLGGLTRRGFWAGGTAADTQIFAETGYGIFLNPGGSSSIGLTLSSSGAATFSSSVECRKLYVSPGGGAGSGSDGIANIQTASTTLGETSELGLLIKNNGTSGYYSQIGFGYAESKVGAVIAGLITNGGGSTSSALVFGTRSTTVGSDAPTERMRITSGGNVLIGSTVDQGSWKAQVTGNMFIRGSNSSTTNGLYMDNSTGITLFAIRNDGYFQTGTATYSPYNNTTGAAANVHVSDNGALFRSTSSLKYKKNIENYTRGLEQVMQLRPVYYKGKSESDGDKQFAGLIAEEVHDLGLTEFVQYAQDGTPDALAYSNMVALLVKAIQEQQEQIQELKNKLS